MKKFIFILLVFAPLSTKAQTSVYELWKDKKPLHTVTLDSKENYAENGVIYNCSNPKLKVYHPEKPNGKSVIICPGGGYGLLAFRHEGEKVAQFLSENGYTAAVLAYRMPAGIHQIPMEDVERAFEILVDQKHDASKIGIIGFSAGGHLASSASVRLKPAFAVLFYPVISFLNCDGTCHNLTGGKSKELQEYYSNQLHVTPHTPFTLIFHSEDDTIVEIAHSEMYYEALEKNGVDTKFVRFPNGNHGWGFNESFPHKELMKKELLDWLAKF